MQEQDPWQVFELDVQASAEQVRQRYLELVRRFPPDQAPEQFRAVNAAYKALSDPLDYHHRRLGNPSAFTSTAGELVQRYAASLPRSRVSAEVLWDLGKDVGRRTKTRQG